MSVFTINTLIFVLNNVSLCAYIIAGPYRAEKLTDMSWAFLSLGWLYFFHFVPLNYLAVVSVIAGFTPDFNYKRHQVHG